MRARCPNRVGQICGPALKQSWCGQRPCAARPQHAGARRAADGESHQHGRQPCESKQGSWGHKASLRTSSTSSRIKGGSACSTAPQGWMLSSKHASSLPFSSPSRHRGSQPESLMIHLPTEKACSAQGPSPPNSHTAQCRRRTAPPARQRRAGATLGRTAARSTVLTPRQPNIASPSTLACPLPQLRSLVRALLRAPLAPQPLAPAQRLSAMSSAPGQTHA